MTKIAFIGAGSTVFMKNLIGDALSMPALAGAEDRADGYRQEAAGGIRAGGAEADRLARRAGHGRDHTPTSAARSRGGFRDRRLPDRRLQALHRHRFRPAEEAYGLRQTIADTLGIGGIMRGLRTVPHLWKLAEDMRAVCPEAIMLQYVNPMAINTWALGARIPDIKQVGLCHSVQGTAEELARDLGYPGRGTSATARPASTTWPST
jgi:alpha-galactosidase